MTRREWQPIETIRLWETLTVWLRSETDMGFAMTGQIHALNPLCVIQDDGTYFWPHENGVWATDWIDAPTDRSRPETPIINSLEG